MVTVNATPSDPAANSYLTPTEADALFEGFSGQDAWDELDEDTQCQLLLEGTRLVDSYKRWGPVRVEGQRLAFPRVMDAEAVIPEPVRLALVEFLNYKVDGQLEPLKKLQAEGVTSASILGQSSNFKEDPSRLPAPARNMLDELWFSHWPKSVGNRDATDCSFFG
jgi:hypothetical protein